MKVVRLANAALLAIGFYLALVGLAREDVQVMIFGAALWVSCTFFYIVISDAPLSQRPLVPVYLQNSAVDMAILRSILDDHGIQYHVQSESLGSLLPGSTIFGYNWPTIFIHERDVARVTAMIQEYVQAVAPEGGMASRYSIGDKALALFEFLLGNWVMPKKAFPVRATASAEPFRCILEFHERSHNYHATCRVDPYQVPVTVEKPVSREELQQLTVFLEREAQGLVVTSLAIARSRRATSGVRVEVDYSDPRIHVQGDTIHVNWVIRAEGGGDDEYVDVCFTASGEPLTEPDT